MTSGAPAWEEGLGRAESEPAPPPLRLSNQWALVCAGVGVAEGTKTPREKSLSSQGSLLGGSRGRGGGQDFMNRKENKDLSRWGL